MQILSTAREVSDFCENLLVRPPDPLGTMRDMRDIRDKSGLLDSFPEFFRMTQITWEPRKHDKIIAYRYANNSSFSDFWLHLSLLCYRPRCGTLVPHFSECPAWQRWVGADIRNASRAVDLWSMSSRIIMLQDTYRTGASRQVYPLFSMRDMRDSPKICPAFLLSK